jgi:hypothetical protein
MHVVRLANGAGKTKVSLLVCLGEQLERIELVSASLLADFMQSA